MVKKQMLFQNSLRRHAFLSGRAVTRAEMRLLMARIITRGGGQRNFYLVVVQDVFSPVVVLLLCPGVPGCICAG
jgi:hypothetical protein